MKNEEIVQHLLQLQGFHQSTENTIIFLKTNHT